MIDTIILACIISFNRLLCTLAVDNTGMQLSSVQFFRAVVHNLIAR